MRLFALLISSIFVNNIVFMRFLGCCPFLGVSSKVETAKGMGLAVVFVITMSSVMTWLAFEWLLVPLHLEYLYTLAFILIIALFVQLVEIAMKKLLPPLYRALGVYLPLITTNCAVLGVTINNIDDGYGFWRAVWNAVCVGLGLTLALVIFSGVRSRIEAADVPETFRGIPATLVAAAIVSMGFTAFSGMI